MKSQIFRSSLVFNLSGQIGSFQAASNMGFKFPKIYSVVNERKQEALRELLKEDPNPGKVDLMLTHIKALEELKIYDN